MLKRNMWLLVLLFAWCLWLPDTTYAAEVEYRITASELNQLENNLSRLKTINEKYNKCVLELAEAELKLLKNELKLSKEELTKAKNESILLKTELIALKQTSQTQTELLQIANKSLETYAAEEKKRQRAIKTQRNVAYGLSAILLYALVRK